MLGSKAIAARTHKGISRVAGSLRPAVRRPALRRSHGRVSSVRVQNLFGFFAPKTAAPDNSAKAAELVEELIDLVNSKASSADVTDLVKQLQPYGTKNPVRNKLLFGEYKVVYSSKPVSGSPRQFIEEPDVIREVSDYKALGLLPGTSTQSGGLNAVSGDQYQEVFDTLEVRSPITNEKRDVDVTRNVTILYLDQELRIVRTKGEDESGEGTLVVYERVQSEDDEQEEEEDKKQGTGIAFFGGGPKESLATISERQVRKKMAAEQAKGKSNARPSPAPAAAPAARAGTAKVSVLAKDDAKAKEAEAKNRAQAAAQAKEKQEAIKAQLEALGDELREAQEEARQAAKEAKELERSNGAVLKQIGSARAQLKSAADDVDEVEEALAKATAARAAAESAVKEALSSFSAAQNKLKSASKAAAK